jgi:hypothetical protein
MFIEPLPHDGVNRLTIHFRLVEKVKEFCYLNKIIPRLSQFIVDCGICPTVTETLHINLYDKTCVIILRDVKKP